MEPQVTITIEGRQVKLRAWRYAVGISLHEIAAAHAHAKRAMLAEVERRSGVQLPENVLTIGFARRATTYIAFATNSFPLEVLKSP
jgi:starch phosphorylase